MYVSRLSYYTQPGKTVEAEQQLKKLLDIVKSRTGARPRILHTHFASLGAPDLVFEQEAADITTLEEQIKKVTGGTQFKQWSSKMSGLLIHSPKREIYLVVE